MANNKDIIKEMTIKEKASLTSGKDFWQTQELPQFNIPSIFLADGPHGVRKQAVAADHLGLNESLNATCFPTAVTIASSWNLKLGEELGKRLGKEALAQNVSVLLGPGVNIKRNPRCGRNFEYFSEDPYLAGKMAASYIKGIQTNGISACVKHFVANNQEHRRLVNDSIIDERTLREIYLQPFEIAVKEGKTKTLMTSYNLVNGVYANENKHLLRDILRDTWNYSGVIVTDWGGSNDRISGLIAGSDLEMPTTDGETNDDIVNAIEQGEIKETLLDETVDRLLTLINDTAIPNDANNTFDKDEHHDFARRAAEESIVLLKNGNNLLPLKANTHVALIGEYAEKPRYQGAGSSIVNPTKLDSALDLIDETTLDVIGYEKGYKRYGKKSKRLINKAVKLAENAEVILLYLGLDEVTELEGKDKDDLKLPHNQLALIDALASLGKPIVVTLSYGSVVEMPYLDKVDAVVHGFLGGQAGAKAMLNVLTGVVNPSGKLTETIAKTYDDYATSNNYPGKELTAEYREGLYVGYRYFEKVNIKPQFPFGFGLSYTTFDYTSIKVEDSGVTVTIENTGNITGKEIVQMYVKKQNSAFYRPEKELKGFAKVELKPKEVKTVTIPFDDYTFRYFNIETNQFEIEGGTYLILVGPSSENTILNGTIDLEATTHKLPYQNIKLPSYQSGEVKDISTEEFERLLGHETPKSTIKFYKKKRLIAHKNTTIEELRYARGWFGRLIAFMVRLLIGFLKFIGKRDVAAVLSMGILQQPLRGLSRMSGGRISWDQLHGIIDMVNGHFFRGLKTYIKAGRAKRKRHKERKKEYTHDTTRK